MLVVDVGANDGSLCKYLLENLPSSNVIAVEPNFVLHRPRFDDLKRIYSDRFQFAPFAISKETGVAQLYASHVNNGQIASLLPINNSADWNHEISSKLRQDDVMQVQTLTVRDFLGTYGIKSIDFLKIDTQGTDLDILEAFLEVLPIKLIAVEIELSGEDSQHFYQGGYNSLGRLVDLTRNYGFQVYRMVPVSGSCIEYNVFLSTDIETFSAVSEIVRLRDLPPFKRFWEVIGVGSDTDFNTSDRHKALLRKLFSALWHPWTSYKSVLRKLTA